jgi:hypothetical protein
LKAFKKTYNYAAEISKIRNETAGHYNSDFYVYYSIIEKLDKIKSIDAIENFIMILMSIVKLVQEINAQLKQKII